MNPYNISRKKRKNKNFRSCRSSSGSSLSGSLDSIRGECDDCDECLRTVIVSRKDRLEDKNENFNAVSAAEKIEDDNDDSDETYNVDVGYLGRCLMSLNRNALVSMANNSYIMTDISPRVKRNCQEIYVNSMLDSLKELNLSFKNKDKNRVLTQFYRMILATVNLYDSSLLNLNNHDDNVLYYASRFDFTGRSFSHNTENLIEFKSFKKAVDTVNFYVFELKQINSHALCLRLYKNVVNFILASF